MRLTIAALLISIVFVSCNSGSKGPDVSDIKIALTTQRFEQDLFKMDSQGLYNHIEQLQAKYPSFGENFFSTILTVDPKWGPDTIVNYVGGFIKAYKTVYDTAQIVFKDFSPYEKEVANGLKHVKHYFPEYKVPQKIITYIGPADGYGDILSDDAFLIGLQHHLGNTNTLYKTDLVRETYPEYISNRFEPAYISINCMKNIVDDIYPEKADDRPMIDQMVEKGKRLYILSQLLPSTEEYKLIGYTDKQLQDCYKHEANIWNMFTQNSYLQVTDKNIIKNYIGEAPKTQELGEGAPGNIGSFCGWQIVKKYMQNNPAIKLQQLMQTDAETIIQETKYKP